MTIPTVGPIFESKSVPMTGIATTFLQRRRYRQKKPYDLQLPYYYRFTIRRRGDRSAASNYDSNWSCWFLESKTSDPYESFHSSYVSAARARARIKFNSKRNETASVGVALAEAKEAVAMITKRVTQLAKAANSLRKFRFYDAAEALGLLRNKKPRRMSFRGRKRKFTWTKHPIKGKYYPRPQLTSKQRRGAHAFSDLWLEYAFGWAPTVQDTISAMKVLDEPLVYQSPIRGSGRYESRINPTQLVPGSVYDTHYSNVVYTVYMCTVGGVVTVKNPNKDLARRLGLVNLPAIALELVPFSFVANWFINLDQYTSQFTDLYGVEVSGLYYTDFVKSNNEQMTRQVYKPPLSNVVYLPGPILETVSVARSVGSLPMIELGLRPAYHLSISRAVTQSALLIKLFTGRK